MSSPHSYHVIGLMSGSSLDGVDLAYCTFHKTGSKWLFKIRNAETVSYKKQWLANLQKAHALTGENLLALDVEYGTYLGNLSKSFVKRNHIHHVDFIASHGHTIFHQPSRRLTFQLGNGHALYAASGYRVVNNFRSHDVALGGEGAPLVPVGDRMLFGAFDFCLNIGGIANISYERNGRRIAFDICSANTGLNYLAAERNKKYDRNGRMAAAGAVDEKLLAILRAQQRIFYKTRPSLGRESFTDQIQPILDSSSSPTEHKLRTFTEFVALEISEVIRRSRGSKRMLCTGGGAFNSFLLARLSICCGPSLQLEIPEAEVIKYKEALVFGLLGILRVRGEINCLKSVTHARLDSSAGDMIGF